MQWVALTKDLVAIPELKGKLLLDLVNEPDGYNLTWDSNSAEHGGEPSLLRPCVYGVRASTALRRWCGR